MNSNSELIKKVLTEMIEDKVNNGLDSSEKEQMQYHKDLLDNHNRLFSLKNGYGKFIFNPIDLKLNYVIKELAEIKEKQNG